MENVFTIVAGGTSIVRSDVNTLGANGYIDDYIFDELIRLTPANGGTPYRGIMPYGFHGELGATVAPTITAGGVQVFTFRAVIGPRAAIATDAKSAWRGARSVICTGTGALSQGVFFAANSSGNPRWDLVYCAVKPDDTAAAVVRKVKSTTTDQITDQNVTAILQASVTIGSVAGTPSATPAYPATPADDLSTPTNPIYYIPLAYVRIPNGFNPASSHVAVTDIAEAAPVLVLSPTTGAVTARPAWPASQATSSWGSTGTRSEFFLPAAMSGMEVVWIPIDATNVLSNVILDSTRDWRNRFFRVTASAVATATFAPAVASSDHTTTTAPPHGTVFSNNTWGTNHTMLMSSSFNDDTGGAIGGPIIFGAFAATLSSFAPSNGIYIYVDRSDGTLRALTINGAPGVKMLLMIEASPSMPNR